MAPPSSMIARGLLAAREAVTSPERKTGEPGPKDLTSPASEGQGSYPVPGREASPARRAPRSSPRRPDSERGLPAACWPHLLPSGRLPGSVSTSNRGSRLGVDLAAALKMLARPSSTFMGWPFARSIPRPLNHSMESGVSIAETALNGERRRASSPMSFRTSFT